MRRIMLVSFILPLMFYGIGFFGVKVKQEDTAGSGGGVFKSTNRGDTWQWKVLQRQIKKRLLTIGGLNVHDMIFDPQDSLTIYLASYKQGLWVTYNGGGNWQQILAQNETITGVAVDPTRRRVIYAGSGRRVFRSLNAGGTWTSALIGEPLQDYSTGQYIMSLAVDSKSPNRVYAGLSDGSIYVSQNYTRSWQFLTRLNVPLVIKILVNPTNSRIIYAATHTNGIYKTVDRGRTWQQLSNLSSFPGGLNYHELTFIPFERDALLYAADYGLLKSLNGGKTWVPLPILTSPNSVKIYSLAINPRNPLEIYYGTATNFYRSIDSGKSWITKILPTTRAATVFLIDPVDQNIIYMGVASL